MHTIITEKMVFRGDCLTKIDGKNVFVPYAIPGEKIEIEIEKSEKDYDTARIVKVLEPSPYRILPACPLYGKCGGCNMMHIDYEYQKVLRTQILQDILDKQQIPYPEIQVISGEPLGYRARFQLTDGGLMEKASNKTVNITNCPIAQGPVNEYFSTVPQSARPKGRVHLFGSPKALPLKIASPVEKIPVQTRNKKVHHTVKRIWQGAVIDPESTLTISLGGKNISFDVRGFFQSNPEVLEKAIPVLTKNAKGKSVLDMYCGSGTFSVFLADCFDKVYMVEHNRQAIIYAEQNMAGLNHESYGTSGAKWVNENADSIIARNGMFDCVVIDPPRSGMEKEVLNWIIKNKPYDLRIVSCDPATNGRDLKALCNAGYVIRELYLLDFYPQTSHIETLALLKYAGE